MISINSYLDRILDDFQEYLDEGHQLCDLKSVHFDQGQIPDYEDIHIQQYYLLRYAYGYAFEYKLMYETLFKKYPRKKKISVTSIGCGTMLDYWALARVLKQRNEADVSIRYTGIDLIGWNYLIPKRDDDTVTFCKSDAIDAMSEYEQLESNVYFFPKSISEFSNSDFKSLCKIFRTVPIKKNRIHILVSMRSNESSLRCDLDRVQELSTAISKNGFLVDGTCSGCWYSDSPEEKICKVDSDFKHPGDVVNCLKELHTYCSYYQENDEHCEDDCERRLSWWPILNQSQVRCAILTFERETS